MQLPKLSCFSSIYNSCMFPILGKCLIPSNINAHQITNQMIIKWDLSATPASYELRYREALMESTQWTLVSTSRYQSLENMRCLTISSAVHRIYNKTSTGCYWRTYTTWIGRRHSMQTVCTQISQRSPSFVLTDPKLSGKEVSIVSYTKIQSSTSAGSLTCQWDSRTIHNAKAEERIRKAIQNQILITV